MGQKYGPPFPNSFDPPTMGGYRTKVSILDFNSLKKKVFPVTDTRILGPAPTAVHAVLTRKINLHPPWMRQFCSSPPRRSCVQSGGFLIWLGCRGGAVSNSIALDGIYAKIFFWAKRGSSAMCESFVCFCLGKIQFGRLCSTGFDNALMLMETGAGRVDRRVFQTREPRAKLQIVLA